MTQNSVSKLLADSPLEAATVVLFGTLSWSGVTAIRSIALNTTEITGIARHSPWFVLQNGRPMTQAERQIWAPRAFPLIAGGFGRIVQVPRILVAVLGLVSLAALLLQKTF